MLTLPRKHRRRLQLVVANSLNQILLILFSPLLSFLVIRLSGAELWGSFVNVMIGVQLGASVVSWGNKEYLLREFSRTPAGIAREWQASATSRLPLLLGLGLLLALLYPAGLLPWLLLWAVGLFLSQSHDVLVVYKKEFLLAAALELGSILLILAAVLGQRASLQLPPLVIAFSLANLLKGVAYTLYYRHTTGLFAPAGWLANLRQNFRPAYFSLAFPFFLLGFSGMLNSRIDLYAVNIFLTPTDVAHYQVFTNFMLYIQAAAGFILLPFVKTIYRLETDAIQKICRRLFLLGLFIIGPALALVYLLITHLYRFTLPPAFYFWGALYVLPLYYFLPIIYTLYKAEQQALVIRVNLLGIGLNFVLDLLLLPRIGPAGAIIAAALVKWLIFIIYLRTFQRLARRTA